MIVQHGSASTQHGCAARVPAWVYSIGARMSGLGCIAKIRYKQGLPCKHVENVPDDKGQG
eukprot:608873-Pelagomonas_calceolata.AAC.2